MYKLLKYNIATGNNKHESTDLIVRISPATYTSLDNSCYSSVRD